MNGVSEWCDQHIIIRGVTGVFVCTSRLRPPLSIFVCVHVSVTPATTASPHRPVNSHMAGLSGISTFNPALANASFHPRSWAEPACRAGSGAAVFADVCVCEWEPDCVSATSEPRSTDQWASHCPSMGNNVLQSDRRKKQTDCYILYSLILYSL